MRHAKEAFLAMVLFGVTCLLFLAWMNGVLLGATVTAVTGLVGLLFCFHCEEREKGNGNEKH